MSTTDPRPHVLVDVADLQPGDLVLSWYPGEPVGPRVVKSVDRRPVLSVVAGVSAFHVDVHFEHGTQYAAQGDRKVHVDA